MLVPPGPAKGVCTFEMFAALWTGGSGALFAAGRRPD